MKKTNIYTKTGDSGETSLVSGKRIQKSDIRLDLYGELDELNSRIGYSTSLLASDPNFSQTLDFLHHVQSVIFDLGSNLACEEENRARFKLPQITLEFITEIEQEIDKLEQDLDALKNFILPGGSLASASLHLCRTNARSVERKLVQYYDHTKEALPEHSVVFLNRLSDYFFVLARNVNKKQKGQELCWKPRKS